MLFYSEVNSIPTNWEPIDEMAFPFFGTMDLYHGSRYEINGGFLDAQMWVSSNNLEENSGLGVFF